MRYLIKTVMIYFVFLLAGSTVFPMYCEEHQTKDYCWLLPYSTTDPQGGNGMVED